MIMEILKSENLLTYILIVIGVIGIILAYWQVVYNRRADKRQRHSSSKKYQDFPYKKINVDDLAKEIGALSTESEKLEQYVERDRLKDQFGPELIPKSRMILFYGQSGVGKTREAIELIQRLDKKVKKRNVYFASRIVEIPFGFPHDKNRNNIVLFIDDIIVSSESIFHKKENDLDKEYPTLSQRLQETINLFVKFSGSQIDVIITAKTTEYEAFKNELFDSELLNEFEIIELEEMKGSEKKSYIMNLALALDYKCIEEKIIDSLSYASRESLAEIYDFFIIRKCEGKHCINEVDVEDFKNKNRIEWKREIYPHLKSNEKLVLEAISKLVQFSIPTYYSLIIELAANLKKKDDGIKILSRRKQKIKKAINGLDKRWLKVVSNYINCHESRLSLKKPDDISLKNDLEVLSQFIFLQSDKRYIRRNLYYIMMGLARSLFQYGMYNESLKANDKVLSLGIKDLPINPEKAKSEVLFRKGYIYSILGREYWLNAENLYKKSIELDNQNLFVKHALANLYRKSEKFSDSLRILNEILDKDEKNIMAYKTKLEILIETEVDHLEAFKTYRAIKKTLKKYYFPLKTTLLVEFVCLRFSILAGEILREQGKHRKANKRFNRTLQSFEELIHKIPPEEKELEAIVRNAYGCFLYDNLGKTDNAINQLEKARKAFPKSLHNLHKLANIYIDESEMRADMKEEYLHEAKHILENILNIDLSHYHARLSLAKLEAISIEWDKLDESIFWQKVIEIYKKYEDAIAPKIASYPNFHNSIAYHNQGIFLWHIESVIHKRGLKSSKPSYIPTADASFCNSITIAEGFIDKTSLRIKNHLILAYFTLGSYYVTLATDSRELVRKGQELVRRAVDLSRQSGSNFSFYSQNSFIESYVAKLFLTMGKYEEAEELLKSAVSKLESNWKAWWWLGRIYERYNDFDKAINCYEKSAEGQNSPGLYGQLKDIVENWMKKGHFPDDLKKLLYYSKKAYELDPKGELNPKNVSDYGFILYKIGKDKKHGVTLLDAKNLLLFAHKKYFDSGLINESNFPLWYAGECREELLDNIDTRTLKYYIESIALEDSPIGCHRLQDKIKCFDEPEVAIGILIDVINCYPHIDYLYSILVDCCCTPIWYRQDNNTIKDSLMSEIEECAIRNMDYPMGEKMYAIILQKNGDNIKALRYLEKYKNTKDTYLLKALMECYASASVGKKTHAKEIYIELMSLIEDPEEKRKLKYRAIELGLDTY